MKPGRVRREKMKEKHDLALNHDRDTGRGVKEKEKWKSYQ